MTNIENDTPVDDGATEETAAPEAVAAEPQDEAAKLAEQIAALQQDLLYARAETQNVTRRKDKEIADAHAYASTKFARDILSVADNLGRALSALPGDLETLDPALRNIVAGVQATERELQTVLERHGVTRIAALGKPFNADLHQAMMEIEDPTVPSGTVVQELAPGYLIAGRLLRAAMVGVSKGGPRATPQANNEN